MRSFPITATSALRSQIENLDLTLPIAKAMDEDEGYGWTPEKARQVERQYKRFMFLSVTSENPTVPAKEIDKMWHAHILCTEQYAEDCETLFGAFWHHFGAFGMRGPEDRANLDAAFADTKVRWEATFGEPMDAAPSSVCSGGGSCGSQSCCGIEVSDTTSLMHTQFLSGIRASLPAPLPAL